MAETWRNEPITAGDMFDFYMAKQQLSENHVATMPIAAAVWIKNNAETKLKAREAKSIEAFKAFPWEGNES